MRPHTHTPLRGSEFISICLLISAPDKAVTLPPEILGEQQRLGTVVVLLPEQEPSLGEQPQGLVPRRLLVPAGQAQLGLPDTGADLLDAVALLGEEQRPHGVAA